MTKLFRMLSILFTSGITITTFAQQTNNVTANKIVGIVMDSARHYALQAGTVAIYKAGDSSLVNYQLTNNSGEFHFDNLPSNLNLRLIVSYTGYKTVSKVLVIDPKVPKLSLTINMERQDVTLKEVVIRSVVPVRMNGDTLEFNSDAFNLDKNATADDLLRRLPGITVWGDGDITVNGKKVKSLLVNGKTFFGGNTKIATENLPKNAVDKIQVYQTNNKNTNPLDSTTEINIKLKKDQSFGYFGKLSAGVGTNNRYEADASINYFTNHTQFAIVGAKNNLNKVANDINTVMGTSTFKGVGASIEYQPDFSTQGLNKPLVGGFTFLHDFENDNKQNDKQVLKGDYFIKRNTSIVDRNTQTMISLGNGGTQTRLDQSSSRPLTMGQDFSTRFDKNFSNGSFYAGINFNIDENKNSNRQESSVFTSGAGLQSTNSLKSESDDKLKHFSFQTGYSHQDRSFQGKIPTDINVDYSLDVAKNINERADRTVYNQVDDATQNRLTNRKYQNDSRDINQSLFLKGGDFFSRWQQYLNISVTPKNTLYLNIKRENSQVMDYDPSIDILRLNPNLTSNNKNTIINELPSLSFDKSFQDLLINRYSKTLSFNITAQAQFYAQKNNSTQFFQNIAQNYRRFVPSAYISYNNNETGDFIDSYKLSISKSAEYPTIDQLVPLVDSANVYYIQMGNRSLKPSDKKEILFEMDHDRLKGKNTFSYNLTLSAGTIKNSFADSATIDDQGRSTHTPINIDGNKYASASGGVRKAIKFKKNQLQIGFKTSFMLSKNPSFINGIKNWANVVTNNGTLDLNYTFKDKIALNMQEGYSAYRSRQTGANNLLFNYRTLQSKVSASVNCTKKLNVGSNISYNRNTSSGSDPINFTIWNAYTSYRFFEGNNLELKLSALDILHQNTGILSFGSNNYVTRGTVNVLRQYFMATISYYPRQFGKKKKAEIEE